MRNVLTASLLCLAALSACSTAGGGGTGIRRSPNLITEAELADIREMHAMGAIQRLRPNWIRPRGAPTIAAMSGENSGYMPALRVDGQPQPSLDVLVSMPVGDVSEMRFLSPSDATTLYGTGYPNGVIEVKTKR